VVALNPGAQATEEEIIAFTREHLAHFKCPRSVQIVAALPRNPTGKILKRDLRAKAWEGHDRSIV
jgi:acyl-CoA synthetase (AMP-forming)/AMP-acid ligase II